MFTLLPFIAKGLKNTVRDLKVASLMAISQISCRKSLSDDYQKAFIQEIILTMLDESVIYDNEFKEMCLISLLVLFQY